MAANTPASKHDNRTATTPQIGPPSDLEARAELDEIKVAREKGSVTFHEVARAWFGAHDDQIADPKVRERFRREFHTALSGFAEDRGGIESAYYCRHMKVAAALTDIEWAARSPASAKQFKDRPARRGWSRLMQLDRSSASAIHVEPLLGHPEHWQSKELLFDCLDLHYRALEFLKPQHRKICMRRIFAIITSLLGTLDDRAARHPEGSPKVRLEPNELLCLRGELSDTEAYFERHAARRGQVNYFIGMMLGVALLASIWLVAALLGANWLDPLLVTLVAGGIGGVVSVMMRVTRGTLTFDGEAGTLITALLGAFRPLTGGVFGLLTYVLLRGGLVNLSETPIPAGIDGMFYYAGLSFAAGFTERIAQIVPDAAATIAGQTTEKRSGFDARLIAAGAQTPDARVRTDEPPARDRERPNAAGATQTPRTR